MNALVPTCHRCRHRPGYFMECAGMRVYIARERPHPPGKPWVARPDDWPRYRIKPFRTLVEAKAWAHDYLAEYA